MGEGFFNTITAIGTAIVVVAIVALVVSNKSNTAQVIESAGRAYQGALGVAESPVTGTDYSALFSTSSLYGSALGTSIA